MQTLSCPMCRRVVMRIQMAGAGWIQARCPNKRCPGGRPLLTWEIDMDGRAVMRTLDKAPAHFIA